MAQSIAGDGYAYGYRKLTHMLRQDYGLVINEKKVYRLCKELDILRPHAPLPIIRSDNGPQFVSHLFESECERWNVEHERIPPKTPNMNAHIESYHRSLEDECLSMYEFKSYAEAYRAVEAFVRRYSTRRLHSSLHYLSPAEFYRRHLETGLQPKRPVKV